MRWQLLSFGLETLGPGSAPECSAGLAGMTTFLLSRPPVIPAEA